MLSFIKVIAFGSVLTFVDVVAALFCSPIQGLYRKVRLHGIATGIHFGKYSCMVM